MKKIPFYFSYSPAKTYENYCAIFMFTSNYACVWIKRGRKVLYSAYNSYRVLVFFCFTFFLFSTRLLLNDLLASYTLLVYVRYFLIPTNRKNAVLDVLPMRLKKVYNMWYTYRLKCTADSNIIVTASGKKSLITKKSVLK